MATRLQVVSAEYLRELKNGQNFSLNTGDSSDHLLGHVGDRQQLKMTVQLSNSFSLGRYDVVGGDTIILKDGQSFLDEDFYQGGTAYLSLIGTGNLNYEFDILSISTDGSELVATNIVEKDNSGTPTGGTSIPDASYGDSNTDVLRSLVQSEGLVCKFGFVSNTGTNSFISPFDGIEQAYKFSGIRTAAPSPVDGVWNSAVQGSNTGSMTCQFINDIQDNGVIKKGVSGSTAKINSIQEFEIIQDFIIPEYLQGQFNNVVNQLPPEGFVDGLKQIFEFEFRLNLSNPNTSQFGEYNTVKGNVRYFNDNYISADQEYSISNVSLVDVATGQTISSVNASSTTRVTCTVTNPKNPFVDGDPVLLEHSYLPNGDQYTGRTETYSEVWIRNTARALMSAAPVGVTDGVINNFEATFVNAGEFEVQFDLIFTMAQQAELQAGYNYLLAVNVADDTLAIEVSDTTKLVIQADKYTLNTDIAGLANFPQSYVYTRPMMFPVVNPADRFTDAKAWIQDGVLYDATMNLDLVEGAFLESLSAKIVAWNAVTNDFFVLDQYQFQLGGQVVVEGTPTVQQIEIDTTRGYLLADDDKLNKVAISTGTYSAPNQPYSIQVAFRCPWQEWVALPGADAVFYDPAEPNNGLNLKSSRYSLKQNYQIEIILDARISKEVDGESVVTQYIDRSATIEMYDFGEQDGSPITWTGSIQTFDESGADLAGKILTTANTKIRGTFTPDVVVSDPSLYWCEIRLQKANDPGFGYFSTTSLQSNADSDPLSNPATLILTGGNLECEATVDFSKLPEGASWSPTVRFGLIDQSVPVVPTIYKQVFIDFDNNRNFAIFQMPETMTVSVLTDAFFQLLDASGDLIYKASAVNLGDKKTDWIPATSYSDFQDLANNVLSIQSNYFIYIEINSSNYPTIFKEGLNITYALLGTSTSPTPITLNFGSDFIDHEQVLWMNKKASFAFDSDSTNIVKTHYALRVQADSNDSYVDYPQGFDGAGLTALNAAIALLADETKYGVHIYVEKTDDLTSPTYPNTFIVYDVTFIDGTAPDHEMKLQVGPTSQGDQRNWKDNTISSLPGAFTTYLSAYNDTTLANRQGGILPISVNSLFDIQNDTTFSVGCWLEMPNGGASSQFVAVLEQSGGSYGGASSTIGWNLNNGISFIINGQAGTITFYFQHDRGVLSDPNDNVILLKTMNYNFAAGHKYFVLVTYNFVKSGGFYRADNLNLYVNGILLTDVNRLVEQLPADGTSQTNGSELRQGNPYQKNIMFDCSLNSNLAPSGQPFLYQINGRGNPNKRQSMVVWDRALTGEEAFQAYKTGVTSNWPASGNVIHDWDFANIDGVNHQIPDLSGSAHWDLKIEDLGQDWTTAIADGANLNWL